MKIGLLAYSSNTGLGYQTRDFARYLKPEKILISDLSVFNQMETDHSWAFQPRVCNGFPSDTDCEWLVDGMDVVFVAETPLNYHLFEYAKKKGVKTVQQLNPEFWEYFEKRTLPAPDVLACPSPWLMKEIKSTNIANTIHWPVPIDRTKIPERNIESVKTIIHVIGRPASYDRNGTIAFLNAAKFFGMKYKYKVFFQEPKDTRAIQHFKEVNHLLQIVKNELKDHLEIIKDTPNNADMFKDGDLMVLPRRYAGLCLPMWEALSSGMPVIMTNVSPNNEILPPHWLCEARYAGEFRARTIVKIYEADHSSLIRTISTVASNIKKESEYAKFLADEMSWEKQAPIYMQRFEELCKS